MSVPLRKLEVPSAAAPTGAAMDRAVPTHPWRRRVRIGAVAAVVVLLLAVAWYALPKGVAVMSADLTLSTVREGAFRDELVVRAAVVPESSIVLDAVEGGRVEQVVARDGALVKKGELLFRLSNVQLEQELLALSADTAQQLANLSGQRAALAGSLASYRRDLANLEFELDRQAKNHARNIELANRGFISAGVLEESADRLAQQRRLLEQTRADSRAELATREESVRQLQGAVAGLGAGLKLLHAAADGLSVRAPADGRLTGFQLQLGQSVRQGDRIGRVDSPDRFKLAASVDEFYLARVAVGLNGSVSLLGAATPVTLARLDPEVKNGRFTAELTFDAQPPSGSLQAGQSLDAHITLGRPAQALILADGGFYADSGGAWVFVLNSKGDRAVRRNVRLGRRAAGQIEVLEGLASGETVIVSGYKRFGEAAALDIKR